MPRPVKHHRRAIALGALAARLAFGQIGNIDNGLASNFYSISPRAQPNALEVSAVTRDAAGAVYAVGRIVSDSTAFATHGAFQTEYPLAPCGRFPLEDGGVAVGLCWTGVVVKLSATGEILWATLLGGTDESTGTSGDSVDKVAVDSHGNVWVTGQAGTLNFPTTPNAYQASYTGTFLSELSPDGSQLLYSTFTDGQLFAIDSNDALYLCGASAFRFDPAANQVTYSVPVPFNVVSGVVDQTGAFYLAGPTGTAAVPITLGVYSHPSEGPDIALMGIDPSGGVTFSTVIGGAGNDVLTGMIRDRAGNFYLTGIQQAFPNSANHGPFPDFPTTSNALQSNWNPAFLLELSPDVSTLLYATFLGKSNLDVATVAPVQPADLKIGSDGKLRMVLFTDQSDIPLNPSSLQPCYPAPYNTTLRHWVYLQLTPDLSAVEYATAIPGAYVGGPQYFDTALDAVTANITDGPFFFDATGNIYLNTSLAGAGPPYTPGPYFQILDISQPPPPGPACMADYVTQTLGPAAPGLLISIFGPGIGPDQLTPLTLDTYGRVSTQLAGTQILFDGLPAPILSAAPDRVDAVVPFGVASSGKTTISVLRNGNTLGTLTNVLAPAAPKLFTVDGTGYGAAAWNQDGTANSAANPAHVGDTLTFYGTGAGAMKPAVADGTIPQSPQSVTASTPTIFATTPVPAGPCVRYSGDAPGLVEGIFQYNCQVTAVASTPFFVQISVAAADTTYASPQIYAWYVK